MYEQEVLDLLKSEVAFMGTVDDFRPRVRPMKPYVDRDGHIWLFSRFDSKKVAELSQNPRIELCVVGPEQQVINLYGRVKDVTKPGSAEFRVFRDIMIVDMPEMKHYFAEKKVDDLIIYRFVVHEVRYMRENCELTTRVNLPMEQDPDVELSMCQGGFCLMP